MLSTRLLRGLLASAFVLALPAVLGQPVAAQDVEPVDADRVIVRYADGAFVVVSVAALSTVLPPQDDAPGEVESSSGFWYELRDSADEVRYRRIVGNPVRLVYEEPELIEPAPTAAKSVPTMRRAPRTMVERVPQPRPTPRRQPLALPDPMRVMALMLAAHTLERSEAIPASRTFSLLVPRAAEGDELVLFSSPLEVGAEAEAAAEVARLGLDVIVQPATEEGR